MIQLTSRITFPALYLCLQFFCLQLCVYFVVLLGKPTLGLAWIRYVFDFDGTLVNDNGPTAAWRTDWILVRADEYRHSAWQEHPAQVIIREINGQPTPLIHPPRLAVSYRDFYRIQPFLSRDKLWGDVLNPIRLTPDPLNPFHPVLNPEWILPGYYMVIPQITFSRYQNVGVQSFSINSALLRFTSVGLYPITQDFEVALHRAKALGNPDAWQGPAWGLFREVVASGIPELFSLNTARGVDYAVTQELFQKMVDRGQLARMPAAYFIHSSGHPDSLARYDRGPVSHTKVKAIELEARSLLLSPFPMHLELHPNQDLANQGVQATMHVLMMLEDDPVHLKNIHDLMLSLSQRHPYSKKIKFVIKQTGLMKDRMEGFKDQDYLVISEGVTRAALPSEISTWTAPQSWLSTISQETLKRFTEFASSHPRFKNSILTDEARRELIRSHFQTEVNTTPNDLDPHLFVSNSSLIHQELSENPIQCASIFKSGESRRLNPEGAL